jgi:hypothetical protein
MWVGKLAPNILQDQKPIWSFPARLAQGQDWLPTGIVLGSTAGLVVADPHMCLADRILDEV